MKLNFMKKKIWNEKKYNKILNEVGKGRYQILYPDNSFISDIFDSLPGSLQDRFTCACITTSATTATTTVDYKCEGFIIPKGSHVVNWRTFRYCEHDGNPHLNADDNIIFPGYLYSDDANTLIKNCYCYIQPSDVEGLSPIILQVMGLGKPIICSDIKENIYIVSDTALSFKKGDTSDLKSQILYAVKNEVDINRRAKKSQERALKLFSWDEVTNQHAKLFKEKT